MATNSPPSSGLEIHNDSQITEASSSNPYASNYSNRKKNVIPKLDDNAAAYAKSISLSPEERQEQLYVESLREQCDIALSFLGYACLGLSLGTVTTLGSLAKYNFRRYRKTLPENMKNIPPMVVFRNMVHSNYFRSILTASGLGLVAHIAYSNNRTTHWDAPTWSVFGGVGGFCWEFLVSRHPLSLAAATLSTAMTGAIFGHLCELTNQEISLIPYVGKRRQPGLDNVLCDKYNPLWQYILKKNGEDKVIKAQNKEKIVPKT